MPPTLPNPAADSKAKKRLSYGAFGVSVMVHAFLLLMVGGVVLIEQVIPRAPFEAITVDAESENAIPSEEEPTSTDEPMPTDAPATPETQAAAGAAGEASSMPDVITADSSLSFSVAAPISTTAVSALPGSGNAAAGTGAGTNGTGNRPAARVTIFGGDQKTPEAFEAIFYDTKQGKNGKPTEGIDYSNVVLEFVMSGFKADKLSKFFRSDALYPTKIAIPFTSSAEAVKAFDVVGKATPTNWIVHYRGKIKAPKTGTYRFAGYGDDFLYVAVDGRLVLDGCHNLLKGNPSSLPKGKYPNSETITGWLAYGKWVDLVAGQSYDFDVAIGDYGASFGVALFVQEKRVDYAKDSAGHLILPLFRTDNQSVDRVAKYPVAPNGPVFAP